MYPVVEVLFKLSLECGFGQLMSLVMKELSPGNLMLLLPVQWKMKFTTCAIHAGQ